MARVKIEETIKHLGPRISKALDDTIKNHFPDKDFESRDVFKTFKAMIRRKCKEWEEVPDDCIEQ